jgi:universal stress protein A
MIPKKILLCTDFSGNSEPAAETALDYAKAFGAELIIAHVINPRHFGYPSLEDIPLAGVDVKAVEQQLTQSLEAMAEKCRKTVPNVKINLIEGVPADEIVKLADKEDVHLIIMGTHGWTGLSHFLVGSTAENVVRTAHRPVLTVWTCRPQCE